MPNELKSCTQINEEVAVYLEWEKEIEYVNAKDVRDVPTGKYWWWPPNTPRTAHFLQDNPPDYCDEWEHAAPLFEKLWNEKESGETVLKEIDIFQVELGCDLSEGTTRAFHAAFVEEGE